MSVVEYAWSYEWQVVAETTRYYPAASEAIDEIFQTPTVKSQKLIKNGQLFITMPDGKTYNAQGAEVR